MATVKDQLKGSKVRTTKQRGTEFEGWGAFAGRSLELIDRNRNGHAVFRAAGLADQVFLALDREDWVLVPSERRITLRNDFHGTEATVTACAREHWKGGGYVIPARIKDRSIRRLCGLSTCQCRGIRGPQDFELLEELADGALVVGEGRSVLR